MQTWLPVPDPLLVREGLSARIFEICLFLGKFDAQNSEWLND